MKPPHGWCFGCEHAGTIGWLNYGDEEALLGCRQADPYGQDDDDMDFCLAGKLGRAFRYDEPNPPGWCPLEDL